MNLKDITSLHTVMVTLGLVALLLSLASGQGDVQPGSVNNGDPIIDQGVGVSTTIKTTTIRTVPPSTRPSIKTTLGPDIKTTSRATQKWAKTTGLSTLNFHDVLTTKKPFFVPDEKSNEGTTGSAHTTSYHAGLLVASLSIFLFFCSR